MIFHSRNGLYFRREEDGAVSVITTADECPPSPDGGNIEFIQTLNEHIWASVISSLSAGNEHDLRWHAALDFHRSQGRIRIVPVTELPQ